MPQKLKAIGAIFLLLLVVVGLSDIVSRIVDWATTPSSWPGYAVVRTVQIATPVEGQLKLLAVGRGDRVKAGQLLFELESQRERDRLGNALAELRAAKERRSQAESTFTRLKPLFLDGAASRERYEDARYELETARVELEKRVNAVSQAQWELDTKVRQSPSDGIVAKTFYNAGELIAEGEPVLSLIRRGDTQVRFFLGADESVKFPIGQAVRIIRSSGDSLSGSVTYLSARPVRIVTWTGTRDEIQFTADVRLRGQDARRLNIAEVVRVERGKMEEDTHEAPPELTPALPVELPEP